MGREIDITMGRFIRHNSRLSITLEDKYVWKKDWPVYGIVEKRNGFLPSPKSQLVPVSDRQI